MLPKLHSPAPDFELPDQHGTIHKLANYQGRWVLLYFYPKDDTEGCTKEACGVEAALGDFQKSKTAVLGVSADSVESHQKFAKKYKLTFPLLADTEKKVVNAYGVWQEKNFMGKKYMGIIRTSFLINPQGKIAKIYEQVKPETHAEKALSDLKNKV